MDTNDYDDVDLATPVDFLWEISNLDGSRSSFADLYQDDPENRSLGVRRDWPAYMQYDFRPGPLPKNLEPEPLLVVGGERLEKKYGDLFFVGSFTFVSDRMKVLIEEAGQPDVAFYPVTIELKRKASRNPAEIGGGERVEGYWMMYLWHFADIVDWQASELEKVYTLQWAREKFEGDDRPGPTIFTGWQRLVLTVPRYDVPIYFLKGQPERRYMSPGFVRMIDEHRLTVPLMTSCIDVRLAVAKHRKLAARFKAKTEDAIARGIDLSTIGDYEPMCWREYGEPDLYAGPENDLRRLYVR